MKMESRAIGGYGHGYGHGGQHGNAGTGVSDFGESDVGDDVDSSYDTESQRSRSRAAMGTTGRSGVIRSAVVDEKTKRWLTAKTLLGAFSVMLALTMFGLIIAMVRKYGDSGLVHISFIFVGFTVSFYLISSHFSVQYEMLTTQHRPRHPLCGNALTGWPCAFVVTGAACTREPMLAFTSASA